MPWSVVCKRKVADQHEKSGLFGFATREQRIEIDQPHNLHIQHFFYLSKLKKFENHNFIIYWQNLNFFDLKGSNDNKKHKTIQ